MPKVLITGAGGYIGSNAAEYFVRQGFEVTGMIHRNINPRFTQSGARAIHADLNDWGALEPLFAERYDYVLHIAARASDVGKEEWFRRVNFEATKMLASLAIGHGTRRFVYLSTADVYGLHDFHGEGEEELAFDDSVKNPYPKYKIMSERWLSETFSPGQFSCVRPCVVFGNGDTTITPRALDYLKKSPVLLHFGKWKGKNRWPLAHVENVCRSLHAAMLVPEAAGKGVTVLDSKYTTISQFYHALARDFHVEKRLREWCLPTALVWPFAFCSTRLSRQAPLFDPTLYSLDTIIHNLDFSNRRMLSWFKAANLKEFLCDNYR